MLHPTITADDHKADKAKTFSDACDSPNIIEAERILRHAFKGEELELALDGIIRYQTQD